MQDAQDRHLTRADLVVNDIGIAGERQARHGRALRDALSGFRIVGDVLECAPYPCFDMRGAAGPFYAAAGVQTDKTPEALTEFFKELDAIRKPIPAEEIEKAKNYLALLLPRNFETTESLAGSLAQVFVYNLPSDYYTTYTARIRAVTPADVQRAAERFIQPDKFAVVIVGDRKAIEPGITALNLGPIKAIEIDDVMK